MILILTTEAGDQSHIEVIDWLECFKANYIILTGESLLFGSNTIVYKDGCIFCNGVNLTKEVSVVFFRRWITPTRIQLSEDKILNDSILDNLLGELFAFRKILENNLKNAFWIPTGEVIGVNKMSVLKLAKKVGLKTPKTLITNSKEELLNFIAETPQGVITKAIGNYSPIYTSQNEVLNPVYTKEVDKDFIESTCPKTFVISLFQEKLSKLLELRVFYLLGHFYTTAIMPQQNLATSLDSREQTAENRCDLEPYKLPIDIEEKIDILLSRLKLNTGCIDLVLTPENEYVFLEVNPVGQFSGYSRRTGFNIPQHIASVLISIDQNGYTKAD